MSMQSFELVRLIEFSLLALLRLNINIAQSDSSPLAAEELAGLLRKVLPPGVSLTDWVASSTWRQSFVINTRLLAKWMAILYSYLICVCKVYEIDMGGRFEKYVRCFR